MQGGNPSRLLSAATGQETVPADGAIQLTVALGSMLVPLNSTMIAVALPRLISDFHSSLTSVGWLLTGYLIAMASLQPVAGKLGDRLGRRPLILGGLVWFGVASLAAGLAPSLPLLVLFRVQQAIAGALVFPNGIALLRELAPPGRLAGRLGTVTAVLPLAAAVGPLVGGVLLALGGWRALFLVNLPLLVVPLVLGWRSIPRRERTTDEGRFDLAGGFLLSLLLVAAAWALNRGLGVVDGIAALAVTCLAVPLFVAQELRHPRPVVQLRLFGGSHFVAANGGVALSNLAMYVTLFALPILLTREGGWTSAQIGLVLASLPLTMFALSPLGGRLADRFGARLPAAAGLVIFTGSLVPLALAPADLSRGALVAVLLGAGVGVGLATAPLQAAAIEAVHVSEAGIASGMFSTSRYLGSIVGTSLLAGPLAPAARGFGGFGTLFAVLAGAAAASAALALGLPRTSAGTGPESAGELAAP